MTGARTVALLSTLAGCGGGSAAFYTSVPEIATLGQLSVDQFGALCIEIGRQKSREQDHPTPADCQFEGFFNAAIIAHLRGQPAAGSDEEARTICAMFRDQCLDRGPSEYLNCSDPPPSDCVATVGQYIACLNDNAAHEEAEIAAAPPCESLTWAALPDPDDGEPASCAAFSAACPNIGSSLPSL